MDKQGLFATLKATTAAAMSVAGLLVLSACDEHPYPERHSAPPPAAPSAELMGAPSTPYAAPPVYQQPAYAPPPVYAAPPYDSGSIVAMAPIPNPGEPGSAPYYAQRHDEQRLDGGGRVHARYEGDVPAQTAGNSVTAPYDEGHPAPGRRMAGGYPAAPTTAYPATGTAPNSETTSRASSATAYASGSEVKPAPTGVSDKAGSGSKRAVAAGAAGAALGLAAQNAKHAVTPGKSATAGPETNATNQPAPQPSGDQAANIASLQTTLTDALGKSAVLTEPARFTAGQPADVSLAIPAGFGDTLKSAAQKDGLGDAAASVNMTALLSGDGFAVTPNDTQSVPLTSGQPTEFHWTVTAQSGAKGPLHADVGADLIGGGGSDKLTLGSVQAGGHASFGGRALGITLLVLLAGLALIWAVTRRRPVAVVRERPGARPLHMVGDD
jgi:hypothetical protein